MYVRIVYGSYVVFIAVINKSIMFIIVDVYPARVIIMYATSYNRVDLTNLCILY